MNNMNLRLIKHYNFNDENSFRAKNQLDMPCMIKLQVKEEVDLDVLGCKLHYSIWQDVPLSREDV